MQRLIHNTGLITGDGATHISRGWLLMEDTLIEEIGEGAAPPELLCRDGLTVLDGSECLLIPGLINAHTHGCTIGPLFSSGSLPLSQRQACRNLDRHLCQGTTTVVNVCGLGTPDETACVNSSHPVNLYTGTSHLPSAFAAARQLDGAGLSPAHGALTAELMIEKGAVLIGEVGSGATLGGGVSDYLLIPEAVRRLCRVELDREQAGSIKKTVFKSRDASRDVRLQALAKQLATLGLEREIPLEPCLQLVEDIIIRPLGIALQGYAEAARLGAETGLPVVFHQAAPSAATILEQARRYPAEARTFVAAHSNHPSFSLDECLDWAQKLRSLGVVIDLSSLNSLSAWRQDSLDNLENLVSEGLADIFSTDYGGGRWDGILTLIQFLWKRKRLSLPAGIAMATGRVADCFPRAAAGRGYLRKGGRADLALVDRQNVAIVDKVFIDGRLVLDGGWRCPGNGDTGGGADGGV